MSTEFESRVDFSELRETVENIRTEIHRIVVGQDHMIDLLIAAVLADGHVLIEGVPGIAKTLTAKLLARTLDVNFQRIQFTPDLMPSDVVGTSVFNPKTAEFSFHSGPVFSNFVLIDEINRAPAKTQAALFEVMEERQVTVDGITHTMSPPFLVIATQNPIDQEGTYRLPEAQLDRFMVKIEVHYPSLSEEQQILSEFHLRNNSFDISAIKPVMTREQLSRFRQSLREIRAEQTLLQYIAEITHQTRNNSALSLGASPRASLGILMASKAFAAMEGRDFITPDDIKNVASSVLRHRIMLTPEKEMEGITPEDVITQIITRIEIPR
ncbi:MAG TPA: MoxR family ATPase [Candidatus Kapabacteria bacterium]|nr:MoxR family ATPase [Candidatus Kapabacteria bacterium]HRI30375.1 MoxR family ATPase [Candidatus Kapabacteria bacterium]